MNLLFICDEYPPGPHGGIGTAVQSLARELVRQGHQVWVAGLYDYGYGGKDYEEDEGVRVYRLRKRSEWLGVSMRYTFYDKLARKILSVTGLLENEVQEGLERLRRFIEKLRAEQGIQLAEVPDHQHYIRQLKKPVFFPQLSLPVVARLHGGHVYFSNDAGHKVSPVALAVERKLLSDAAAISSVSRYAAEKTLSLLGVKRDITVLPNGVVIGPPPDFSKKEKRKVIFTGSLLRKKGIYELMAAWNSVFSACPEAELYVYGKGDTTPLQALLQKEALQSVHFMGHCDRALLDSALKEAAVAVFPSFAETFGLAPLEAMAQGTATIFTKRTSGPELIEDGVEGLLVDPARPDKIAAAIISLLQDDALRRQLSQQGYDKVNADFSIRSIVAAHVSFYQQLLSGEEAKQD